MSPGPGSEEGPATTDGGRAEVGRGAFPRDGVPENTHPLNLLPVEEMEGVEEMEEGVEEGASAPARPDDGSGTDGRSAVVDRPPLYEVYMRMAEELAKRSTCRRLRVGTVLTDSRLENVVAIGYNGNARGFPNRCDSPEPGRCGCIHSEMNALVKAPGHLRDKVAFVTASPCVMCAKLMVQANVSWVFYREAYRDRGGLEVLETAGITAVQYVRWQDGWR